jgi:two-component system, LuxR family, response regulator FixJ
MDDQPVIFLVCDKSQTRRHMAARLKQLGYQTLPFSSMEEFQDRSLPTEAGCLVLCISDAESDLAWLKELAANDGHWPVVAFAAEADVEMAVRAMKHGAFDFLLESCGDRRLAEAIDEAIRHDAVSRRHTATVQSIRRRMRQLAPPLRDVLEFLLKGKANREIAAELGLSERTIEDRRAKLMRAMNAPSLVALVRQALLAEGVATRRAWKNASSPADTLSPVSSDAKPARLLKSR